MIRDSRYLSISFLPLRIVYVQLFKGLAAEYEVHIIGGTHVIDVGGGKLQNAAHLFYPDGRVAVQAKIRFDSG